MGDRQYTLLLVVLAHYESYPGDSTWVVEYKECVSGIIVGPSMVTSAACSSRCASTAHSAVHTCTDALAQITPTCIYETDPAGTCLISIATDSSLIFDVNIINPPEFINRLGGYFQFHRNNGTHILLELLHPLDVEIVYLNTNISTLEIQLIVSCTNDSQPTESVVLNVTVIDDDDNSPSFSSQTADSTCLLPVFTASAHEQYTLTLSTIYFYNKGPLTTTPSCLCVTDGDFVTNNDISLSFLHGNPPDFNRFFAVDLFTQTINKTSNMSADDPREYTFIIQAKEQSAQGRSMVAVLSVCIESGYPAVVMTEHKADEGVKLVLQVLSATILAGFSVGFIILIWHRNRRVKPMTKQTETNHSVIECFTSNVINETNGTERKSPCAKRTEWILEAIEEEPERTSL